LRNIFFIAISFLIISIAAGVLLSCGGGGGGGAASLSNSGELHNGGGAGGWGNGGNTGNGFGGSSGGLGSGGESEVIISGGTPLDVTGYIYNGTTYPDAASLINVLKDSTLPDSFNIEFTVDGEETPRTARVSANGVAGNGSDIFIEHQYKASVTVNGETLEIPFYKRDGISLADIADAVGSETVGSGSNEVIFELQKLKIGGVEYDKNGSLPASVLTGNGDVTISGDNIQGVYPKWGLSSGSSKVVQFSSSLEDGESISITSTELINQIYVPDDKEISLNLSAAILPPSIGSNLFNSNVSKLTGLVLPSGVTAIEENTFNGAAELASISLPDTIVSIGENAFYECSSLTGINLPALTTLGNSAFAGCADLESVTFATGCSITAIEHDTFANCSSLTSINIPASVITIGELAFQACEALPDITLPANLQGIEDSAFVDCKKLNVMRIPASVTYIGQEAFMNCFSDSSLSSNGVFLLISGTPSLGERAFKDCTYIKNFTYLGTTFNSSTNVFSGCDNISDIIMTNCTEITLYSNMFSNSNRNVTFELVKNNITLTLHNNGDFAGTQPLFKIGNVNYFDNLSLHVDDLTTPLWGGKSIYVLLNAGSNAGYHLFNGSGTNGFMYIIGANTTWPDAVIAAYP